MANKRLLSLVLSGLLAISSLYGCSQEKGDNTGKEEENIETGEKAEAANDASGAGTENMTAGEETQTETEASQAETEKTGTGTENSQQTPENSQNETEAAAKIVIGTENEISIPDITVGNLSFEEMKLYFGVDITNINVEDFDALSAGEKLALLNIKDQIKVNFTPEQLKKLEEMSYPELIAFITERGTLLVTLAKLLENAGISAELDGFTGEVVIESNILFGLDSNEISDDGKELIRNFIRNYASVVLSEKFIDLVDGIIIEGHTDSSGDYEYNKKLSERRAESVLELCLSEENGFTPEATELLKGLLSSVGCSYDRPVKNEDGTENAEASRRVTFRVLLSIE